MNAHKLLELGIIERIGRNWMEVPEEQIQIFLEGNNIGVPEDGSHISDGNGMRLVLTVLNMESSVEWLSHYLS